MKTPIISFFNLKGGVGKSCLTNIIANEVAYLLAQSGQSKSEVLVIDLDKQHTNAKKRQKDLDALNIKVDSPDFGKLSPEEQSNIRQLQLRYSLLYSSYNFCGYTIIEVDTTNQTLINTALDYMDSDKYAYVFLDFPGTLDQPGTEEFYDRVNHLIIPVTINESDVLGAEVFINEISQIGYPQNIKSTHFLLNKYDFPRRKLIAELQKKMEEQYGISFLKSVIKNAPTLDTNSILPASLKINLLTREVSLQQTQSSLQSLADEIINISHE